METALGITPVNFALSTNKYNLIMEACKYIDFSRSLDKQAVSNQYVVESLSTIYMDALAKQQEEDKLKIFEDYFGKIDKQFKQEIENQAKKRKNLSVKPINDVVKRGKYQRIFGSSRKNNELNIVEDTGDNYYPSNSNVISSRTVENNQANGNDNNLGVPDEINETAMEVEENLKQMRKMHMYLLMKERVNLRELLQGYFEQQKEGYVKTSENVELTKTLTYMLIKYKDKYGDVIQEYLENHAHNLIPMKYEKTMY